MAAVTTYIETTPSLLSFAKTRLEAYKDWNVGVFTGTNLKDLMNYLPALKMPCAAITYGGAEYRNNPRRTAELTVIVAANIGKSAETSAATVQSLLDKTMELLDNQITGHAKFEVEADEPLDLGPGLAAIAVHFTVKDF
jgi:hydroxymethylpyrimidine pyrophosphatase-like HAD family hydrolase